MARGRAKSTSNPRKAQVAQLPARPIRARFDVARTTPENRKHWMHADTLAPDAALTPEVRSTLRMRARYEIANNSYARGMEIALVNYVIGTGPTLNVLLDDKKLTKRIEADWVSWAVRVNLAQKLRTMRAARFHDGEVFALFITNHALRHHVKLDLRLVEADQVETPNYLQRRQEVSGIKYDNDGNPIEYHVLKDHPGSGLPQRFAEFDRIPASQVIHWFVPDRPGQCRAIPEITPALRIFADIREYTLAVLSAARTAAQINVLMETQAAPVEGPADVEPMAEMELVAGTAVFAPKGWKPSQIKAEQPTTVYVQYIDERLREAGRCVSMPLLIVLGSAKDMNYSSGKLDHQGFFRYVDVNQTECEIQALDPIVDAWWEEERRVLGIEDETLPHKWDWPPPVPVDKQKEISADIDLVEAGLLTEKRYWERMGLDPDAERKQRDQEAADRQKAGLPPRKYEKRPETAPTETPDSEGERNGSAE